MGIVRTVEWSLVVQPGEAVQRLTEALASLDLEPQGVGDRIVGRSSRSLRRNRWAADVSADVTPMGEGCMVVWRVDMIGNKHYAVLNDIADALGEEIFADQGIESSVRALGKLGRLFGRKEVRHLRHVLYASERVLCLGQGTYDRKQGLIVLTNERLFFLEKSLGEETVEAFALASITSLEVGKKITGEKLVIFASGNKAEITNMPHGHADDFTRAFRNLSQEGEAARASVVASRIAQDPVIADPLDQIEKLASLRDRGLISEAEFEEKKAELLGRL